MNPFLAALREPVEAFADLGTICLFLSLLVGAVYLVSLNLVAMYVEYDEGGWTVNPPARWVARLAGVPAGIAIIAWIVSAMFAMLG